MRELISKPKLKDEWLKHIDLKFKDTIYDFIKEKGEVLPVEFDELVYGYMSDDILDQLFRSRDQFLINIEMINDKCPRISEVFAINLSSLMIDGKVKCEKCENGNIVYSLSEDM